MQVFDPNDIKKLYKPANDSTGEDNGQVTVIGGSSLFHGAPLLSLKVASRICDMVFFATPEKSVGYVAEQIKSKVLSFIWVPWDEVESYIDKSDAVLIGPGLMRYEKENQKSNIKNQNYISKIENYDDVGKKSREITKRLLKQFPKKKWVIDAGSLQVMEAKWIPEGAIVTPNKREFEKLFKVKIQMSKPNSNSQIQKLVWNKGKEYNCIIVFKGPETIVCSSKQCVKVTNGNPGMTKGGTGDVLAGLTAALVAKNDAFSAATAASYVAKAAADELYEKVGTNYNADDLADNIPEVLHRLSK